ncbi:hypothetical protein yc1106_04024 [Curvularia clavata]|uniref:Uncharacterized protein n=1 Tax=Curvularia clavata TaxID=95742 RepID=A0A9Q9DS72_CURCL|nr:hypothetical protein yc1106_04024 [Curvularia clavata]
MSSEDDISTDHDFSDEDDDDEPFSINAIIPTLAPHTSSWNDSASVLWSKDLIERGYFRATDSLLLAFTVDVGMKLYIVGGIQHSVLDILDDSGLVWTILNMVRNSLLDKVKLHGWGKGDIMASVECFFLAATTAFPSIRERFEIAFLQNIQDPRFKQLFAIEILFFCSCRNRREILRKVYRWVYGEWPESICAKKIEDIEKDLVRPPITIRQWVFNHN